MAKKAASGSNGFTGTRFSPCIDHVSPTSMPSSNSDLPLTLNGRSFDGGATLTFDPPTGGNITSTEAKFSSKSSTRLVYNINNANDVGTWQGRGNNPDGQASG